MMPAASTLITPSLWPQFSPAVPWFGTRMLEWLLHLESWPWSGLGSGACALPMMASGRGAPSPGGSPPPSPSLLAASPYHTPVLAREVLHYLAPGPERWILDGTLGGGGHSELLLEAGASVIGLDQDLEALEQSRVRLRHFGSRFFALQSNFRNFPSLLQEAGIPALDGLLIDVGVSSHQLDDAARGFSFMSDGPLDMRMNASEGRTAADLINEESEEELARIFFEYGEERQSRRIARAIVRRREQQAFHTTGDLASFIASISPRRGKTHPATLCFQGLRIAVNDELSALTDFLKEAPRWLKPGGRLVVISFHSLEDRIVKHTLQNYATEFLDRPEWPAPRPNPEHCMCLLTRKPVEGTEEEVRLNPRARSARLRAAERI